jgi:hypothetical protein
VAVVKALALVGQFNLTLIEDGLKHLGTVGLDAGVESAVAGIAYALTDALQDGIGLALAVRPARKFQRS